MVEVKVRERDCRHVGRRYTERLQLLGERDRHAHMEAAGQIRALFFLRKLVAQPGVPEESAFGMTNNKTRDNEGARLPIVFSGIRKDAHVLEIDAATVERVQTD